MKNNVLMVGKFYGVFNLQNCEVYHVMRVPCYNCYLALCVLEF